MTETGSAYGINVVHFPRQMLSLSALSELNVSLPLVKVGDHRRLGAGSLDKPFHRYSP